jgi:hypothetical protein
MRDWTGWSVRGIVLISLSLYARATLALATVAIVVAGCADSRVASNSATPGQAEQPYKTGYGFSSDGPTTDLYSEIFGSRKTEAAPAPAAVATQQIQPSPQQAQPAAAATRQPATVATRQPQPALATTRQAQPPPAPVQVAQQPATPQPPPEPDVPAAYGITANGPTTDLYTELFGPRRREGQ